MKGVILKGIGGFYYALGEGSVHTLRAQAKFRRDRIKPMAGDHIEFTPGKGEEEGWITAILPRKNSLVRPPVANIDLLLLVVAASAPVADLGMVDRLMINASLMHLDVRLIITKADEDPDHARQIAAQYENSGASPICVSGKTSMGLDELRTALAGNIFALAGQSGAGKSTLINALYGFSLETGSISSKVERGRHTTRACELIPLEDGGMVLDTPGFSLLEIPLMDPITIKEHYREFAPYEGQCYFSPCLHDTEPRCAARDALADGKIDPTRYARYQEILQDMKIRWRERYG